MRRAVPKWLVISLILLLMAAVCGASAALAFERGRDVGYQEASLESIREVTNFTARKYLAATNKVAALRAAAPPGSAQVLEERIERRTDHLIEDLYDVVGGLAGRIHKVESGELAWQTALQAAVHEFGQVERYHILIDDLSSPASSMPSTTSSAPS